MENGELRAGKEGWMICEDQDGRLKGMTLQHKRTMAFMRQNDLMVVVMTTLAVELKGELVRSMHNWWMGMSNSRQMVGLVLRVQLKNWWLGMSNSRQMVGLVTCWTRTARDAAA